ncbi:MAG: helix-turn-helix domain-containing protein [Oscillospiraceae bacterium]|nr:helix-turn-helix domain-containing protein [Oscillospiraceae bacterium]
MNELTYHREGDYLLPDLIPPEAPRLTRRNTPSIRQNSPSFSAPFWLGTNSYIKFVKVERAKTLLLSTNMDIQEICDALSFGSRSFFSQTFRSVVGVPPAAYREQNQHI